MKRAAVVAIALCLSAPASADSERIGHKPTAWAKVRNTGQVMRFARDYMRFIGANKTEREVVGAALAMASKRGFRDLFAKRRPAVRPGARLVAAIDGKLAALIVVGKRPLAEGLHVIAGHIDAVRIDLKQRPLYADGNLALLQTHYYGGIKKYQWLSTPLELRGVVVTRSGKRIDVSIGADPDDPVFVIPDVAVHVARQVDRTEGEDLPGESLDPIIASTPLARAGKRDPFAARAAALLKSKYKIEVADLTSAELELVPAAPPRDVGIDRALIGAYGQDDRSCSYAALRAILATNAPDHTAVVYLADKEEIGSHGNTGARSTLMRRIAAELLEGSGVQSTTAAVDRVLAASMVFSADVTGAVNPAYRSIYEKGNAAFVGSGLVWNQSAGSAEVLGYVRRLLDGAGVTHQPATWTKSGSRSGGTVLEFFTRHGMRGLDVSIPLLSMHSPYEIISKIDLYEAFRGYRAFLAD